MDGSAVQLGDVRGEERKEEACLPSLLSFGESEFVLLPALETKTAYLLVVYGNTGLPRKGLKTGWEPYSLPNIVCRCVSKMLE